MTCTNSTANEFLADPTPAELESFRDFLSREIADRSETMIVIGGEDGLPPAQIQHTRAKLTEVARNLNCDVSLVRSKAVPKSDCEIQEYLIRRQMADENDFTEVRVAVIGNVDAGKSTLLGVLTQCTLDNGRGSARQRLLRHKHEKETGRTSSVGNQIIGFDSVGNVTNQPTHGAREVNWSHICTQSSKIINFFDLAGHEKYFKTTVFGMMGNAPDFCLLVVGSNAGVNGMAREHLGLAIALNLPVLCVVTKIDQTSPNIIKETISGLGKLLKSNGIRKIPLLVQEDRHTVIAAQNFASERIAPIFKVSSVTGEGLDRLKSFLNLIQPKPPTPTDMKTEFVVEEIFAVPGVGTVVSGVLNAGKLAAGDSLNLGPDALGKFRPVTVKSIERKRLQIKQLEAGQSAALALKKVKKSEVRKGSVLIATNETGPKEACLRFKGQIVILHHPTTIKKNYQAVVHVGAVRQSAKIIGMSQSHLRTGDRAEVTLEFQKRPEWIHKGQKFIFREGRTKAIGTITERLPVTKPTTSRNQNKMEIG
jgi:GTPase